jgi:hypothetical protein
MWGPGAPECDHTGQTQGGHNQKPAENDTQTQHESLEILGGASRLRTLLAIQRHPDACYETKDFLDQGTTAAAHRRLDEFVTPQSWFTVGPADLVFQEDASRVVDKNGNPTQW